MSARLQVSPAGALPRVAPWLILTFAWLTAFSSRSTTIAVAPVLPLIQNDLHMSFAQRDLLFTLPILLVGLFSIPGGLILARLGVKGLLVLSLVLLCVGSGLRAFSPNTASLFVFTALTGAGVGLVQPVLPRIVKDLFTHRTGLMTGIYSTGFPMGAVLGASLAVPLLLPLSGSLSWRGPFLLWTAIAGVTVVAWLFVPLESRLERVSLAPFGRVVHNRLCWMVSALFLSQSMLFYILNAELGSYYQGFGWTLQQSAVVVTLLSLGSIPSSFLAPALSDRLGRRTVMLASAVVVVVAMIGLVLWPEHLYWLWPIGAGSFTACIFTTCFVIPVDVAEPEDVGAFTGVMLAVGYGGVVFASVAIGFLRDVTGSHLPGLLVLLGVALIELFLAYILPETRPRPAG